MQQLNNSSRIFISYSHRGRGPEWKAKLLTALAVFERQHLLDVWEDGKIRVSAGWNDEITDAMSSASLVVFLLTPEALESEYILKTELPLLRDRWQQERIPVFPVVCEPCRWKEQEQTQWLHAIQSPAGAEPLSGFSEAIADRHLRDLATAIAGEQSRMALAGARPPTPPESKGTLPAVRTYLDKFPLTRGPGLREEKLIGREQELALLDLAFAQPHTAIVSLVAWGGVGKTMLVQHWLQRLQREGWFGARRVYAWSFYSQGTKEDRQASEDTFLAHALEWFGVQCEPTLSPWDKGRLLADAVAHERTLLILDGIEPLQYPPGPMGGQLRAPGVQSLLKQLARRANSAQSQISNRESQIGNALCLVTTREPLTDLADFQRREGSPWGSVLRVDLGNLTDEAGAALLHHAGAKRAGAAEIKSDDKELLAASREVNGHALTLNLLGRFLARAHGGDIRRRDLVKFEEADRKEQGGTTFKMLAAFENWFARSGEFGARQLAVLRMLGLFDRPADAGCICALRKHPIITGLTDPFFQITSGFMGWGKRHRPLLDEDWNTATSFLTDFGLVVVQADADSSERLLDCHPLIREHFAKRFREMTIRSWYTAHRRLFEYLCMTTPDRPQPTLKDLQPLYQAIAHGCQAGMQQEARLRVFSQRIRRRIEVNVSTIEGPVVRSESEMVSIKKLGAFGSDLGAIACFFEQPWNRVSPALPHVDCAWLLNEAAYCLRALGRLTEAIEPMRAGLEMRTEQWDWINAAISASNLSELKAVLGELAGAVEDAKQAMNYTNRFWVPFHQMGKRCTYADALHQAGCRADAEKLFREAETIQAGREPDTPLLYGLPGFRYCDLLLVAPERAAWQLTLDSTFSPASASLPESCHAVTERAEKTLDWWTNKFTNASLLDIALDHLTLGRAALYEAILARSSLDPCHAHLQQAVDGFRRAGRSDYLPRSLLTRAWLRFLECDSARTEPLKLECASRTRADLDEAWDIAERGPMRLHMADIHLHRARLFFRETPYPWQSPQADLAAAEKRINECGYHRRDEELADAKRAILGAP